MLRLYREVYFDLNIRHFHEKLSEEHAIQLSYTWVQKALRGAGLVAKGRKKRKHRRRRERRSMPGMPLHIDGSNHQWFGDERWYDFIVILDDATSEIYYAIGGRGIYENSDERFAGGDSEKRIVLLAV